MTDNEIIKAFDILDKFEFFGGQRAGRELWFNKPADIQEKDIGGFLRDIDFLKQFINRQKAKIKALQMDNEQLQSDVVNANMNFEHVQSESERLTKENDELKNGFFQEHYKENECQELLSVKEAWRKESLHNIDLEAEIEAYKHYYNECLKDLKNAHAEIEKLQKVIFKKEGLMQMLFAQKQAYYDELVKSKSDLEKLTQINSSLCEEGGKLFRERKTIREKAIKEFAERLKPKLRNNAHVSPFASNLNDVIIDNLIKEITEGKP